jgi:hypothetical protein
MTDAQLILGLGLPTIAALIGFTLSVYLVTRIRGEMRGMRDDMRAMRSEVRDDLRAITSDLSAITGIVNGMNKRLDRIEGRM